MNPNSCWFQRQIGFQTDWFWGSDFQSFVVPCSSLRWGLKHFRRFIRRFMRGCWAAQDRDIQPGWDGGYWPRMGFHLRFLQQFETKALRLFIASQDFPWRTVIGVLPKTPEWAKTLGLDSIYQHIMYSTVSFRRQKFSHFFLPQHEYYT